MRSIGPEWYRLYACGWSCSSYFVEAAFAGKQLEVGERLHLSVHLRGGGLRLPSVFALNKRVRGDASGALLVLDEWLSIIASVERCSLMKKCHWKMQFAAYPLLLVKGAKKVPGLPGRTEAQKTQNL